MLIYGDITSHLIEEYKRWVCIISMESSHPGKNLITLQLRKDGPTLTLSSLFDSGNMATAELGLNGAVIITPANDCASNETPSHAKGWFYFSASAPPLLGKVKFVVRKMSQLSSQVGYLLFRSNSTSIFGLFSAPVDRNGSALSRQQYLYILI